MAEDRPIWLIGGPKDGAHLQWLGGAFLYVAETPPVSFGEPIAEGRCEAVQRKGLYEQGDVPHEFHWKGWL